MSTEEEGICKVLREQSGCVRKSEQSSNRRAEIPERTLLPERRLNVHTLLCTHFTLITMSPKYAACCKVFTGFTELMADNGDTAS